MEQKVLKSCSQRTASREKTSGWEMHNALTAFLCNFPGEPQLWDFISCPLCSKAVCQSGILLTAETQLCLSNVLSLEQTALARLLAILQSPVGGKGNQRRLEGVVDVIFAPERLTPLSARPSPASSGSWNTLGAATGEDSLRWASGRCL